MYGRKFPIEKSDCLIPQGEVINLLYRWLFARNLSFLGGHQGITHATPIWHQRFIQIRKLQLIEGAVTYIFRAVRLTRRPGF